MRQMVNVCGRPNAIMNRATAPRQPGYGIGPCDTFSRGQSWQQSVSNLPDRGMQQAID
jgi:hypothetical protein